MSFGLDQKTLSLLGDYFARHPEVEQVKIYGSRAMEKHEKGSDIDLAVYTAEGTQNMTGRFLTELDELSTPYLFDVTDYRHTTHLPLKEHIDRHGKLIYTKKDGSSWNLEGKGQSN